MSADPDLDAAIVDLAPIVAAIRQLEGRAAKAEGTGSRTLAELHTLQIQRGDLIGRIRLRADKMKLPWRSLMLIVEEANRLKKRLRRRPDERTLMIAVQAAQDVSETAQNEADAELNFARAAALVAGGKVTAATAAVSYMRASHAG